MVLQVSYLQGRATGRTGLSSWPRAELLSIGRISFFSQDEQKFFLALAFCSEGLQLRNQSHPNDMQWSCHWGSLVENFNYISTISQSVFDWWCLCACLLIHQHGSVCVSHSASHSPPPSRDLCTPRGCKSSSALPSSWCLSKLLESDPRQFILAYLSTAQFGKRFSGDR